MCLQVLLDRLGRPGLPLATGSMRCSVRTSTTGGQTAESGRPRPAPTDQPGQAGRRSLPASSSRTGRDARSPLRAPDWPAEHPPGVGGRAVWLWVGRGSSGTSPSLSSWTGCARSTPTSRPTRAGAWSQARARGPSCPPRTPVTPATAPRAGPARPTHHRRCTGPRRRRAHHRGWRPARAQRPPRLRRGARSRPPQATIPGSCDGAFAAFKLIATGTQHRARSRSPVGRPVCGAASPS